MIGMMVLAAVAMQQPAREPDLKVTLDSTKKEVVVVAGPFDAPQMAAHTATGSVGNMIDHGEAHDTPLQRFEFPTAGYMRGFKIEVTDTKGQPLPRHILHHLIVVNFDRRQLVYEAPERIAGGGAESGDIFIPKTIGLPLEKGMKLGVYAGWHNDLGRDLDGVMVKMTFVWSPLNMNPKPVAVLPIYMDVNLTPGMPNSYDVPPGVSVKSHEFTLPVSGRLLGVGAHLHDYGLDVRLEDAETGKVLTSVKAKRLPDGRVTEVGRNLFGVSGEGIRMVAGHRYRVVGRYDNPGKETIVNGAMAHLTGIFSPDDMSKWPKINPDHPDFQRDVAVLNTQGEDGGSHDHGSHDHGGQPAKP